VASITWIMDTHAWRNTYHRAIRSTTLLRTMKTIRNMSVFSPINCELEMIKVIPSGATNITFAIRSIHYSPSTMILLNLKDELRTHQLELH
jgi:hypothetical protein